MKYVSDYEELKNNKYASVEELRKAEADVDQKQALKVKQTKERKLDATKVENAFKARNTARTNYNKRIIDLRKEYNKELLDLKKNFETTVEKETAHLTAAEDAYNNALKSFTDKHPEGYHMTLHDGDNVTTISKNTATEESADGWSKLFSAFDDVLFDWLRFM